jgi:hypothetical protein
MFVDRRRAAAELARVAKPGGRVLAAGFFWRTPPSSEAKEIFLGQVCPELGFDMVEDWVTLYASAGLDRLETETGPFEMMTPLGILADEDLAIMARAVPYLGDIVVAGMKPR